ncbi:flavin reductase family protein [Micromonospora sp. HM5-17]|uniref:flavin reductase family protein n=1 Tax=Micromonospora sp. HM5-17 TaxID=2487710 RepID=UPI001F2CF053|nr:flavin reductase family protein [Micromonospora sp. HM5-17]
MHRAEPPGGQIHHTDPFATPEGQRSPIRRFRGRLAAPVTLWTAYARPAAGETAPPAATQTARAAGQTALLTAGQAASAAGETASPAAGEPADPAGLTVSSTLVADGDPPRLLGLVDEESDLWAAASASGRFAVALLGPAHRRLADRFAGLFPAPGGLFATGEWTRTPYGPVPADAGGWAGCRLDGFRAYGWALLVEATIETVELTGDAVPLLHHRGRYRELAG